MNMAFTYLCPTCVAGSLVSTVNIEQIIKNFVVSRAFFDTDGSIVPPVVKQRIITLCSNGHRVNNDVNKLPEEVLEKMQFFLP